MIVFMYLDDWLIVDQSREATMVTLNLMWCITRDLGFSINTEKSCPCPTQFPVFLGASLNLHRGLACPTEECILNLHQCVSLFLPSSVAPARAWLKLLGLMASLVDIVDLCRLRMCPIQLHYYPTTSQDATT